MHLNRDRRQIMAFDKKKFKKVMRRKGVTQKDLAEKFCVDIRTVNRWLDPKYPIPSDKVRDLCVEINKIPNEFDPDWEGSTENQNLARVSAKVSSASKNGYWLMKKKYGISETELVELAPTLFAIFAAATLERKSEGENEQLRLAAEILASEYGFIHESHIYPPDQDWQEVAEEERREEAIACGKLFGYVYEPPHYSDTNPFAIKLENFARNLTTFKIKGSRGGQCPDSRGTAFDIPLINEISGNNAEFSEAISNGDIKLFTKEFEEVSENREKLMRWMKNQVSSAKKLEIERIKTFPKKYRKLMEEEDAKWTELGLKEDLIKKWQISEN